MTFIPSNATFEERLKYYCQPEVREILEPFVDEFYEVKKELEKENEELSNRCSTYYEQMYFCKEFIEEAMVILRACVSKYDFLEAQQRIELLLENSYVEL